MIKNRVISPPFLNTKNPSKNHFTKNILNLLILNSYLILFEKIFLAFDTVNYLILSLIFSSLVIYSSLIILFSFIYSMLKMALILEFLFSHSWFLYLYFIVFYFSFLFIL